jgi:hypothetical protein
MRRRVAAARGPFAFPDALGGQSPVDGHGGGQGVGLDGLMAAGAAPQVLLAVAADDPAGFPGLVGVDVFVTWVAVGEGAQV